jgi:hypothetical protein
LGDDSHTKLSLSSDEDDQSSPTGQDNDEEH